jgi:CheY-like chemotaxis protein
MNESTVGILLCDDLIFASRITGTAQSLGLEMKTARSADVLRSLIEAAPPRCILLDLGNASLKLAELMEFLKGHCTPLPRLVAYGSHVDAKGLAAARAAGCDPVLPRSKFVEELPTALPLWLK